MKALLVAALAGLAVTLGGVAAVGCSSSSSGAIASDAGDDGARILACPPATDAGAAAAAEAGVVATILEPTDGQMFGTNDKVTFRGTGSDPTESNITDPTRMIWNIGKVGQGVNPDGEGPEDTGGPYPAGTYTLRFDVSSKTCQTAAASVTITVQ